MGKEPTQEQIKEFWEWCGFKWQDRVSLWDDPIDGLISSRLPTLTLDNLFKYAVPKLQIYTLAKSINSGHFAAVYIDGKWSGIHRNTDPTLALFWAIWEVKKEGRK